jgi:transcriptional regulator GlxA family with amidase domain
MQISVFVPEYGVIEAVTPPYRSFLTANEFLTAFGKKAAFEVEYVGLQEYVPANNGEYTIKTHRLLKDVSQTDLLIIPPTFGDTAKGLEANKEAIPYFKALHGKGSSLASLCIGAFSPCGNRLAKRQKMLYSLGLYQRVQRKVSRCGR